MSSPSNSDRSSRSSIYWGSDSESPMSESHDYFPPPREPNPSNPPRPRLSSQPRFFQSFFGSDSARNRHTAALAAPVVPRTSRNSIQDVNQAIENMNRAVQTAHEAFSSTAVVDLTDSPPNRPSSSRPPVEARRMRRRPSSSVASQSSSSPDPQQHSNILPAPRYNAATPLRQRNTAGPDADRVPKRRRLTPSEEEPQMEGSRQARQETPQEIESIDLTEVKDASDLSKALSKQRQDAIKAQMKDALGSGPEGRTPLTNYKCPICMDTPEDATATVCGHLFCHKCIIETLRWSEEQRQDEDTRGKAKGTCPVCRKPMASNDKTGTSRTLIPLEVKLMTKKRGIDIKGKGVAKESSSKSDAAASTARSDRDSSTEFWNDLTFF